MSEWPRVRYEVRDRAFTGTFRAAGDFPLPGTAYERRHLIHTGGRYGSYLLVPRAPR